MPSKAIWPVIVCDECLSEFSVMPYRKDTAKYCSWRCGQIAKSRISNRIIIEKYRGTGTIGYVKENGRHQHRIAAEKKIGRALIRGEIVHHIDGDKHNNHPDNLEVMTQSQHAKLHSKTNFRNVSKLVGLKCTVSDCERNQVCKGFCARHYRIQWSKKNAA